MLRLPNLHHKTASLPISFKYFSPNRWYAGITTTMVDQEITRDPLSDLGSGKDDFNVVDVHLGYRLAKRRGSLSLNIFNAADEEFNYQDDSYREFRNEPSTGPYFPERTVQFQANLAF